MTGTGRWWLGDIGYLESDISPLTSILRLSGIAPFRHPERRKTSYVR